VTAAVDARRVVSVQEGAASLAGSAGRKVSPRIAGCGRQRSWGSQFADLGTTER
jgi:hypothetical protein